MTIKFELGGLYLQYEEAYFFFEVIVILYKMLMTGPLCIVEAGTPRQAMVGMLIQIAFMLLVLKLSPYTEDLDDFPGPSKSSLRHASNTFARFSGKQNRSSHLRSSLISWACRHDILWTLSTF